MQIANELEKSEFADLCVGSRVATLVFLVSEVLDTSECKRSIDTGSERIVELRRERAADQAEERRMRLEKMQRKQVELEAEQLAAYPGWLKDQGLDPETHQPELHPILWKTFADTFAKKVEVEEEETDEEDESDEEGPGRTNSRGDDDTIMIENEDQLSRGEYLRRMRAAREQANAAKLDAQLKREHARAEERRKREEKKAVKDKERAHEAQMLEKQQQYEESARTLAPRLTSLGYDRFYNRYWYFGSALAHKICVEKSQLPEDMLPGQLRAYAACMGTEEEKRQAAVQDTKAGMAQISIDVLHNILLAMKVDFQTDSATELVTEILKAAVEAPCSDSYFSMIVFTNRASEEMPEELSSEEEQASSSEDESDDEEGKERKGAFFSKENRKMASPLTNNFKFYETKEQLDALVEWLQPNGQREAPLKKEIGKVYGEVVKAMEAPPTEAGKSAGTARTKKLKSAKSPLEGSIGVVLELISSFVPVNKANRAGVEELKARNAVSCPSVCTAVK